MDEDAAELAALRRRAYGPDADIHDDPTAVARLVELENRRQLAFARDEPATAGQIAYDAASPLTAEVPSLSAVSVDESHTVPVRKARRYATLIVAGAAIAAVAIVMVAQAAVAPSFFTPTSAATPPAVVPVVDTSRTTILHIPLDGSLGHAAEENPPPQFPVEDGLRWAESVGPYYGWTLWLAKSAGTGQRCILLDRGDRTYARCVSVQRFLSGLLDVSVPYGDVAPEFRPEEMTPGQTMIFRWVPEDGVSVVLDEADITYFGDND